MTIAPDEVYMAWPSPNVLFLWILVSVYVVHGKRNTISHVVLILRKFQTGSNWKRFLCSISYWYMKSIYHIPLPSSPLFTLPFPQVPPPTVPILQFCISLLILKSMFKGVSWCIPAVGILYFDSTPSIALPYPFSSHPLFSIAFSAHPISSTFTDIMFYDIKTGASLLLKNKVCAHQFLASCIHTSLYSLCTHMDSLICSGFLVMLSFTVKVKWPLKFFKLSMVRFVSWKLMFLQFCTFVTIS
jgi:hypothetical protein